MSEGERELWLRVSSSEDELRSLRDWLRHEDGLRGRVRAFQSPLSPGEMGGALDALAVAVGSGGMGAVLANCLSTWISQRRSDVRITVSTRDGRTVEVDAKGVDPQALARDIERMLNSDEAEGNPQ
ncbi:MULTISPECIES: effector-associated constant component EACC1 [unclassified Streptomyces]|uniref:effector-associated constant component EACC1 n=1 Tax=unclassified Streptomyces TaxID=2593676 RepID=UPI0024A5699D|nr:hypothetical protein [Streptomyces hygroscopicus]GLX49239.1 hypothetical protein Shyhy01_21890 [Streptomyces hygroscopicus subsp. hygroscopicus]